MKRIAGILALVLIITFSFAGLPVAAGGGVGIADGYTEPEAEGLVSGGAAYRAFERFSASLTVDGNPAYAWGKDGALVWSPHISNEAGVLTRLEEVQWEQFVKGNHE